MVELSKKEHRNLKKVSKAIDENPIVVLAEMLTEIEDRVDFIDEKVTLETDAIKSISEQALLIAEQTAKKPGPPGYTPVKGVDYFDGKDYVLTPVDKSEIASLVPPNTIEKIIERTEVIKEQPIVKETTHNTTIENPVTVEQIVDKLNTVQNAIEPSVIKRWDDIDRIIKNNNFDVRIGVSQTELQRLVARVAVLESNSSSSSSGYQDPTSGTVDGSNQTFVWATEPRALCVDGIILKKTDQNGDVNWTGTTTTILTNAPTRLIFAIA